jgi:uncharacterized peroxidase-related enzyme
MARTVIAQEAQAGSAGRDQKEERVPFIETPAETEASEHAAELLNADRERLGYVPNYGRLFAHRPAVYEAWQGLNAAIKQSMHLRRYELATLAAARRLRSSYCMLAHGKVLVESFVDGRALEQIVADHRAAGLDDVDVAVMDLAEKVVDDATAVTQEDVDRLRALGLTDAEIFDVVLAAAARCFFSKCLDALGTQPDAAYRGLDAQLREALTVGRPIAVA